MCKISEHIRFCSCEVEDSGELRHYWVLYRFNRNKNDVVIGLTMLAYDIDEESQARNKALLLERVNDPAAFDVQLELKEKDRLELNFTLSDAYPGRLSYGFEYRNGRWVEMEFDALGWLDRHEQEAHGKIEQALDSDSTGK